MERKRELHRRRKKEKKVDKKKKTNLEYFLKKWLDS